MHSWNDEVDDLADRILEVARHRIARTDLRLDHPRRPDELARACGQTVTPDGIGGIEALRRFTEVLAPSCLPIDHARFLSFVPSAPTEVATLFDLVVGAYSIYGGSWLEGAGAVHAENEALAWLCDLCGLDSGAGGVFVPGGTVGNLSALVAARGAAATRLAEAGRDRPRRWAFLVSETAHSSIPSAAAVMDAEVIPVEVGPDRRLTGDRVAAALDRHGDRVAGVVATAGSTNLGVIDDLASIGRVCRRRRVFLHVDAAYGGAALASPSARSAFDGIELADSVIIDPHKWLFAPFDCCALLWRDPALARSVHTQQADYLAFLDQHGDWNPSDYAIHLTRRARGLPFWFSLATHGTDAYGQAVQRCVDLAAGAAGAIDTAPHLRLVWGPSLSVVVFERTGWAVTDYERWSTDALARGLGFVVPSRHDERPVLRFCFVNPRTTLDDVAAILDSLR